MSDEDKEVEYTMESFPTLEEVERKHIFLAMKMANGNKSAAAKMLGITLKTIYNKMDKYTKDNFKNMKEEGEEK